MKIPMLDLGVQHRQLASEIESAVKAVLDSQQFIMGPEVRQFESEMAAYCKTAHGVGCASGSDALLLALMACGVGPGDEVITTSFSFFATVGSIIRLGAKPVFVDIDPLTFNIDESRIEDAVTGRTKVILPVHLFGQCCDMDKINAVAGAAGLKVVEDAAQAIGAEFRGQRAGGLGAVAAFSFYPSKNLGAAGDGGALTTNDDEIAEGLRILRSHGAKKKYYHDRIGMNSRLDSIQAAILRVKFKHLDEWSARRRENARNYDSLLGELGLVERGKITLPREQAEAHHVYNQYVICAEDRDGLKSYLAEKGVGTEIYYPVPLHLQVCFRDLGYNEGALPHSEKAAREALAIPIYPELGKDGQEYVAQTIASYYE